MRVILVSLGLLLVVAGCGNSAVAIKPTPSPTTTPSSAITRFVKITALAYKRDVHAFENPAEAGLVGQVRAADANLKTAARIAPPNNGSQRWRLANRFDVDVAASTTALLRLVAEAAGARNVPAGQRDLLAAAAWAQRAQSAYGAYLAHVKHVQVHATASLPSPGSPSPAGQRSSVVAPDWAGYGATGGGFDSVTATWSHPAVSLPRDHRTMEVSTWVGLDGQGDVPLEQIGTEAFCADGTPFVFHRAFFEMFPKPPVYFALEVNTGDQTTATVTSLGDHRFRMSLIDDSTGERFATTQSSRRARGLSAEIIVEAPSMRSQGLAEFRPVHLTACAFNGRPISAFDWTKTLMRIPGSPGSFSALPSALDAGGTGFTVTRR